MRDDVTQCMRGVMANPVAPTLLPVAPIIEHKPATADIRLARGTMFTKITLYDFDIITFESVLFSCGGLFREDCILLSNDQGNVSTFAFVFNNR